MKGWTYMTNSDLQHLRSQIDEVNMKLLKLINERGELVQEIGKLKGMQSTKRFDPVRERAMLDSILSKNEGPFQTSTLQHIFKEIFKAHLELQEDDHRKALLVSRKRSRKIQSLR